MLKLEMDFNDYVLDTQVFLAGGQMDERCITDIRANRRRRHATHINRADALDEVMISRQERQLSLFGEQTTVAGLRDERLMI